MISIEKAGELCAAVYGTISPDAFDRVFVGGNITVGYKLVDGMATFTFAGSETKVDWVRDFLAVPYDHPTLGTLHLGFWEGMDYVFHDMGPELTDHIAIEGHSLGCAHAAIFAGLCITAGHRVEQLIMFAPPRPGYKKLHDIIQTGCNYVVGFHNGLDPVPELPIPLPVEPWCHVTSLVKIWVPPSDLLDVIVPSDWHNLDLYRKGTKDLF